MSCGDCALSIEYRQHGIQSPPCAQPTLYPPSGDGCRRHGGRTRQWTRPLGCWNYSLSNDYRQHVLHLLYTVLAKKYMFFQLVSKTSLADIQENSNIDVFGGRPTPHVYSSISRTVYCYWLSRHPAAGDSTTVAPVSAPRFDLPYTSYKTPCPPAPATPGAPRSLLRDPSTLYYLLKIT